MVETEAVLLRRFALTGDAEAFAEIIRRHAGLVYGAAWRILADMDRASDIAQETFLQLTKDAAKVTGSLPGWLHRVATHKAIDSVRRDASRRQREAQYAEVQPRPVTAWREISPHVDESLNALEPEMREILVAHFLEGQTTRQIACTRGISQATVSRRLEAGVVTLRRRLRQRGLLVAAGALSLLLGENAINAAPATLMTELGKMALVGGHAAVFASVGSFSGLRSVLEGLLMSAKTKAVAATVVAAVSVGSVVTYQQVTKLSSASPAPRTATASLIAGSARHRSRSASVSRDRTSMEAGPQMVQEWQQRIAVAPEPSVSRVPVPAVPQNVARSVEPASFDRQTRPSIAAKYGYMIGEDIIARERPVEPAKGLTDDASERMETPGSGDCHSLYGLGIQGPNDSNDPNSSSVQMR